MKRSALLALVLGSLVTPLISSAAAASPAGAAAVVRAVGGLNVRAGAATDRAVTATLTDGSKVRVVCQVYGELVKGSVRTNALSGWGRSTLTRLDHSYFGVKCFGSPGAIAVGCSSYATYECTGSRCYSTRADFRAYRSMADSFADHGRQLATLARYQTAMKYASDPERFAREVHKDNLA